MLYHVCITLGAFLVTLLGTRLVIVQRRAAPDMPTRPAVPRQPVQAILRGGGGAIVVALTAYLLATNASYALVSSVLLLSGLAFVSRWVKVPTFVRLVTHALLLGYTLHVEQFSLGLFSVHWPLEWLVMLCGWIWMIQAYEAMDGIDGMASVETLSIATGVAFVLAVVATQEYPLFAQALVIAAAASGFLWWHWPPAKLLLGRSGNCAFGCVTGYALLGLADIGYGVSSLILASYFLMESLFTTIKRLLGDHSSLHYYALAARSSVPAVTIVRHVLGGNFILIGLAIHAALYPERAIYTLLAAVLMVGVLLLFFERLYHRHTSYVPPV